MTCMLDKVIYECCDIGLTLQCSEPTRIEEQINNELIQRHWDCGYDSSIYPVGTKSNFC